MKIHLLSRELYLCRLLRLCDRAFCAIEKRRREACLNLSHLVDGLAVAAMKAVASCDKPGVAACQALNPGLPNYA